MSSDRIVECVADELDDSATGQLVVEPLPIAVVASMPSEPDHGLSHDPSGDLCVERRSQVAAKGSG